MYLKVFLTRVILMPSVADWERKAKKLAAKYIENFEQYCVKTLAIALKASGPQL